MDKKDNKLCYGVEYLDIDGIELLQERLTKESVAAVILAEAILRLAEVLNGGSLE